MSAQPTSFVANNGNYANKDLSEIFSPLVPNNYDKGTWQIFIAQGFVDVTTYYGFAIQASDNPRGNFLGYNSFTQATNNGIVTTGVTSDSIALISSSYLSFSTAGTYKIDLGFVALQQSANPDSANQISYQVRFNINNTNIDDAYYPLIPLNQIKELSCNGGTGGNVNVTNLVEFFNNTGTSTDGIFNQGYPFFNTPAVVTSAGVFYWNKYTISLTLEITSNDFVNGNCLLYPQLLSNSASNKQIAEYNWKFAGDWKVTKLA